MSVDKTLGHPVPVIPILWFWIKWEHLRCNLEAIQYCCVNGLFGVCSLCLSAWGSFSCHIGHHYVETHVDLLWFGIFSPTDFLIHLGKPRNLPFSLLSLLPSQCGLCLLMELAMPTRHVQYSNLFYVSDLEIPIFQAVLL